MQPTMPDDRFAFDRAVQSLESEVANVAAHLQLDSSARIAYAKRIRAYADEMRRLAESRRITWSQAAEQANEMRNSIMTLVRGRSTPVGLAFAQQIKASGRTLNELVARKTLVLFGPDAVFDSLSLAQRNQVFAAIVESAGTSNPRITLLMRRLGKAGRGLLFLSVALSVYEVATAEDKWGAAKREAAVTGAGVAGGFIGGGIAGLACGPGAPVCVTIGAFVGGAAAALGVQFF